MKVIGLEEHFVTPELSKAWGFLDLEKQDPALRSSLEGEAGRRLLDFGTDRLAAMNDAGVDVQVLSLTTPGVQNLNGNQAVSLAQSANDRLADAIKQNPDRFQGFATLPTSVPRVAVRELERAIRELGLQGAMVFGRTGSQNLDHRDYWPIFEAASALRVPLYLHPQTPQLEVREAYYSGFGEDLDSLLASPGIGWHYETGMQIVRMALAGVFERFPDLQIITGHMGEVVLFYLDRIDMLSGPAKLPRKVSEYFQSHVYLTPSGLLSQRYLRWAIEVLGTSRIMMSTDYPFVKTSKGAATTYLRKASLTEEQRMNIASGTWERICSTIQR